MRRRDFIAGLGATAAWPAGALAQNAKTIGFLSARGAADSDALVVAFLRGVSESAIVEGRDFRIEYRWANGHFDALPNLANELVAKRVLLIAAVGGPLVTRAASDATKTIPIVFVTGADPVKSGVVDSLNRPSGNMTGVTLYSVELQQKNLQLLREIVPGAASVGALLNPSRPEVADIRALIEAAARSLHVSVEFVFAGSVTDIEAAFGTISAKKLQGLVVGTDAFFSTHRAKIIRLAAEHSVPAIYDSAIQVAEGGLMSYGASYAEAYRQAGIYAGRILKGAQVADLPVLLPTKFELMINLKTAKALGLDPAASLLARADQVIE
jgi:putative ABC transport system substrate-binding protein